MKDAFEAIQRNYVALAIYAGSLVAFSLIMMLLRDFVVYPVEDAEPIPLYDLSSLIVTAVLYALVQSVAFARLGREMDRPFWKIETDGEAIRRFFMLWFVLDLANFAAIHLINFLVESQGVLSSAVSLFYLWMVAAACIVPIGAAVMFHGRAGPQEVGAGLSALVGEFPRTLLIVVMALMILVLALGLQEVIPDWAMPMLVVVDAYADFFIFASTWLLCMTHRDREEDDDPDFDF